MKVLLFILLNHLSNVKSLKCYDCLNCPYPWSSLTVPTYGSTFQIFSRVQSCYKKEFYNAIDRRLDRVVRGALDRDCQQGKLETVFERSITYCCYTNYCNGIDSHYRCLKKLIHFILIRLVLWKINE